jgi:hypothetical protein
MVSTHRFHLKRVGRLTLEALFEDTQPELGCWYELQAADEQLCGIVGICVACSRVVAVGCRATDAITGVS